MDAEPVTVGVEDTVETVVHLLRRHELPGLPVVDPRGDLVGIVTENDLVITDVMMPELDGFGLLQAIKADPDMRHLPVVILSARAGEESRVEGLEAGADDYLVKPFALRELNARLRALLRRVDPGGPTLAFGDLVLDRSAHQVHRGTRRIELSKTEFSLLELFLEHPRQVLTRSTLFERVWGYDFGATSNALGVYMGYLRRKTEAGGERRLLHTVRGVGYVLREP